MASNYVDYDYWVYGYGDSDLVSPDLYVTAGYWDAGYAENEDTGATASITAVATVTAKALDFTFGAASITANATVTALAVPDLYVVKGYWVAGYCENEDTESSASIECTATVTANGANVYLASGSITANAQLELNVVNFVLGTAAIESDATVSGNAIAIYSSNADINGIADVNAIGTMTYDVPMAFRLDATVDIIGNVIGYEWHSVEPETNVWSDVPYDVNIWQTVTPKTNVWSNQ